MGVRAKYGQAKTFAKSPKGKKIGRVGGHVVNAGFAGMDYRSARKDQGMTKKQAGAYAVAGLAPSAAIERLGKGAVSKKAKVGIMAGSVAAGMVAQAGVSKYAKWKNQQKTSRPYYTKRVNGRTIQVRNGRRR